VIYYTLSNNLKAYQGEKKILDWNTSIDSSDCSLNNQS
jgi:hypothetical protein